MGSNAAGQKSGQAGRVPPARRRRAAGHPHPCSGHRCVMATSSLTGMGVLRGGAAGAAGVAVELRTLSPSCMHLPGWHAAIRRNQPCRCTLGSLPHHPRTAGCVHTIPWHPRKKSGSRPCASAPAPAAAPRGSPPPSPAMRRAGPGGCQWVGAQAGWMRLAGEGGAAVGQQREDSAKQRARANLTAPAQPYSTRLQHEVGAVRRGHQRRRLPRRQDVLRGEARGRAERPRWIEKQDCAPAACCLLPLPSQQRDPMARAHPGSRNVALLACRVHLPQLTATSACMSMPSRRCTISTCTPSRASRAHPWQ